jgi:hypothetical protein
MRQSVGETQSLRATTTLKPSTHQSKLYTMNWHLHLSSLISSTPQPNPTSRIPSCWNKPRQGEAGRGRARQGKAGSPPRQYAPRPMPAEPVMQRQSHDARMGFSQVIGQNVTRRARRDMEPISDLMARREGLGPERECVCVCECLLRALRIGSIQSG